MFKKFSAALIAAYASASSSVKIGVISDIHFNANYDPTVSGSNCVQSTTSKSDTYAPIGRYGCDSSEVLVDHMLNRFKEKFGSVDVIIIPGDSVAHYTSLEPGSTDVGGQSY